MNLLAYGEFGPMSMENSLIPVWAESAHVDHLITIERVAAPKKYYVFQRICRRLMPRMSRSLQKHNKQLISRILPYAGDNSALIVFKGMEIFPETLVRIKSSGIKLFCFNPDHPFIYSGLGSGTDFMTQSIKVYDGYFTYDYNAQKQLSKLSIRSHLIPFGYEAMAMQQPFITKKEEIKRGCFIGNPNHERIKFLKQVIGKIPIDLYGSRWDKHFKPSRLLNIYGPVHDDTHWKIMAQYRFQLNMMAPHNVDSHNMRTFSAPATGAILLAPKNRDHALYFDNNKEIFLYDNPKHCIDLGQMLLHLSFESAMKIRMAAKYKCKHSGYSYAHRAQQILNHILAIMQQPRQSEVAKSLELEN